MGGRVVNVRNTRHVARTIALYEARRAGWLKGKTYEQLAQMFGVNRSTINRNLRDLDEVQRLARYYLEKLIPDDI